MLYSYLQYLVRFGGDTTECFKALMGILVGDPASPILWILYLSDFVLRPHPDDIFLDTERFSHAEIADDMALASLSPCGMQDKLDQTKDYCGVSSLLINVPKTLASIHGPLPEPLPRLTLYGECLQYIDTTTYVGMSFCSTVRDIFLLHYEAKERSAQRVANACFSLEVYIGPMPPPMALTLYRSHIDPHLTGGCEIALDVRPTALNGLERIQYCFLRRALHVSPYSQIAPLRSGTGIWPLPYRHVDLTLGYLHYLLAVRPVLAHAALRESYALATAPRASASWWGDLTITATKLPVPLALLVHSWPTTDMVDAYRAALPALVSEYLYDLILASQRLPVMQTRVRFDSPAASRPIAKLCAMREYLRLPRHRQRAAITLLLLSEHPLSIEQLRRGPRRLDRHLRICRWCKND